MELHISALYHYPVKSCRGIALDSARLTPYGLERDRHWMVVDVKGRFLTQRRFPQMALIEAVPSGDELTLRAPGMPPLAVAAAVENPLGIRIWGFEGEARDAGDVAAHWLSKFLRFDCRLAAGSPALKRSVDPDYDRFGSEVLFADGFPFLLISEASLASLNARLATSVPMNRFRPNIVVSGCEPHAEDDWRILRVGEGLVFHVVKPCSRCTVPTVDQATGERGAEPTVTLSGYRKADDSKIYFGQNLIHETKTGVLRVGDVVTVLA